MTPPTVALLPGGETVEDFLDPLGLTFEDYRDELTGGWLFGYVEALSSVGVRSVIVLVSRDVARPQRAVHGPTQATIWRLPRPWVNGALHRASAAILPDDGPAEGRLVRRALRSPLRHLAWVASTPVTELVRLLRREQCDAVLCQDYEQPRFDACVLAGRLAGARVVGSFQGADRALSPLERPLRSVSIRAAAGLVAGTRAEARRVQSRYGVAVRRIFNPLDLRPWTGNDRAAARARLGIADDAWVVGWHGRVECHKKGLDVLLDAWERLCRAPGAAEPVLLLIGTGKDAEALRREIAVRRIPGVRWVDEYVLDKRRIAARLAAADVYAFPSRLEGFPVAPVEAMACGLPVVAAAANGVEDILEAGEASGGLVVGVGDGAALAAGLARVRDDEALGAELGRCARARAEHAFSPRRVGGALREALLGPADDGH